MYSHTRIHTRACKHTTYTRRYVWLYLYHSLIFPDDYAYLWNNMTSKRAYTIKNALKGSLSIGRYEGVRNPPFFPMTSYAQDAAVLLMGSLRSYVDLKASFLGVHPSHVFVTSDDRNAFLDVISTMSLLGTTGFINFTSEKKRERNTIVIRNFISNNSIEFAENNAKFLDPWSVEKRAYFISGIRKLCYVSNNGSEARHVTLVFSDGTNTIPSYKLYKAYNKSESYYRRRRI